MISVTKEVYINKCWQAAKEYCEGVETGSIETNENIKLAVRRHKEDLLRADLEWRPEAVEKVFKFFYYLFVDKQRRFTLQPFQAFIILALFGFFFKGTNERRFNKAFLFMGRKNGKTTFSAALQLYFMIADGASFPESALITGSKDQTGDTSFKALKEIISSSPSIRKRLAIMQSLEIVFKRDENGNQRFGKCKVVPGISTKVEGLNPTSCILDELHTYKNADRFNVIKNALGTKPNPMLILISTAGYGKDSFCAQLVEAGRNVLRKVSDDDRFFYLLYELEEGDDINNESTWVKANPGLGTILDFRTFKDEFNTVRTIPSTLNDFVTKRLNIFLEEESEWIPSSALIPRFIPFEEAKVKDLPCYLGVDLSATQDLTSIACLWDGGDMIYVKVFFFFARNENNSLRRGNIDILRWVREDYIIDCKQPTIDYNLVKSYLYDLGKKYKVKGLYFDPWHFKEILEIPQGSKGATLKIPDSDKHIWCSPVQPGTRSFDTPMRKLEGYFFNQQITVSPNKCTLWNFRNVVKETDLNGNFRPNKKKSKDAIDGVIAILNAMFGYLGMNANKASLFMKSLNNS